MRVLTLSEISMLEAGDQRVLNRKILSIHLEHQNAFDTLLPNLPPPRALNDVLDELRHNLKTLPNPMVGEVGLSTLTSTRDPAVGRLLMFL
jgi:hypothetical protein